MTETSAAEPIRLRRRLFGGLVAVLTLLLLVLGWRALEPGGWTVWEVALALCVLANAPWMALAGATAVVGFAVRMGAHDPVAAVLPALRAAAEDAPIRLRTAIAVCVRNEDMGTVLPTLGRLLADLDARGAGDRFAVCVLSDTQDPRHAAAEEAAVARFRAGFAEERVLYRRRAANTGFKAGNVMDFADHHAAGFDLMLCLDADSEMAAATVLRLVRAMQADPRLAILQPTIAGRPAAAAFPRLFQFGHRHGARIWATGQAWWQGDEGPYWGHNAAVRIAPFREHCRLDLLPDGAHILSHDHVEAARLHAAGWKVRVLADDAGSFDSHPPALPDFLRRDQRWAAGNWQYRFLLRRGDLGPLGRLQMLQCILHYALTPLWFAMLPLAALNAATGGGDGTPRGVLLALLLVGWAMLHLPKLLGFAEVLLQPAAAAAYGGRAAFARAAAAEMAFTQLFDPLIALHKTMAMLRLARGARTGWAAQNRSEQRVAWGEAWRLLWPHTVVGVALTVMFAAAGWFALLVALPFTAGLVLAVPFAVWTADPRLSARLRAGGLAAMPEELAAAAE